METLCLFAIAQTPLNGSPQQNKILASLPPTFLLVSFFLEQPSQLPPGGRLPMLLARIWLAKRQPLPYLQYDTY